MSPLLSVLFLAIATTALGLVIRDDPKNPVPVIGPWSYTGCANETPLGRTLNGPSTSGNMTAEVCVTFCTNQDYGLAGLEYGHE